MNNYDEIKMLVEASRRALSGKLNENRASDIRRQYGLIVEQIETDEVEIDDINIDEKPKKDSDEIGVRKDKQKAFRVLNNIIISFVFRFSFKIHSVTRVSTVFMCQRYVEPNVFYFQYFK